MDSFLAAMTRRLRLVWAWAFSGWVAPAVVGSALLLVLVGWLIPWGWFEPAALGFVALSLIAVLGVALARPLHQLRAARAADRGLRTGDAFGAAVEFAELEGDFGDGIRARANELARVSEPRLAAPLPRLRGRWALAAALGSAALVMALVTNPQDEVRAERSRANDVAEELAEELEAVAEELQDPATAEVGAALDQLAEELRGAQSFEEIDELLAEAEQELGQRSPNFAAERAAAEGLEQSLETEPLSGQSSGASAADQLAGAAAQIPDLNQQQQRDLADRLERIADSQEAGDPQSAEKLNEAAQQLRAGNISAAQAALSEAAQTQRANADDVAAQVGAAQASGQLRDLRQSTSTGTRAGSGRREGEGEGEGEGQGEGQGEGSGSGSGQGQGSGSGSGGQGGSGASGQVGGASGGTGAGRGGVGTPGGTDQADVDGNNSGGSIVDPSALQSGEPLSLGGSLTGTQPGEIIDQVDGPTQRGASQVPVSGVVGEYSNRATTAAERSQLPPSQQQLVGSYFDRISQL